VNEPTSYTLKSYYGSMDRNPATVRRAGCDARNSGSRRQRRMAKPLAAACAFLRAGKIVIESSCFAWHRDRLYRRDGDEHLPNSVS
jgi:hypothetical protein